MSKSEGKKESNILKALYTTLHLTFFWSHAVPLSHFLLEKKPLEHPQTLLQ